MIADSKTEKEALIRDFPKVTEILEAQIPIKGMHIIETTKDPPFGPIYNLSEMELASLREYLNKGLDRGWIQHSISPAGAPILFVPKKDGKLRLCVDYCALNAVTRKNQHTLPLISEILDRLNGAQYLTKIDLQDAYHRIAIAKEDQWKTAFRTRYGHFEYCVMPFGLTNSPATFQAYINKALSGLVDVICVVYLDDILIYSENLEDHRRHVREVFERLRRFSLYANLKKCSFFQTEVEFLGFIVGREGIRMDPKRVEAVTQWPQPTSIHDIQIFLGFVNFYRRFIERYSHITRPLTKLLKTSSKGEENRDGQNQPARQVLPLGAREVKGTNRTGPSIEKLEGEGVVFQTARIERTQKRKHKQTAKGPPFVWTDTAEKAFGCIKKSFSGAGRAGTLRSTQAHTPRDGRVQVCNCCDPVTVPRRRSVASSSVLVEEIDPGGDTLRNPRSGAAGNSRCV